MEEFPEMPEFRLSRMDPDLEALQDVVTAIDRIRWACDRYQDESIPLERDAPPGVLEGLADAEVHLVEVMSTLAVTIASDQYATNIQREAPRER